MPRRPLNAAFSLALLLGTLPACASMDADYRTDAKAEAWGDLSGSAEEAGGSEWDAAPGRGRSLAQAVNVEMEVAPGDSEDVTKKKVKIEDAPTDGSETAAPSKRLVIYTAQFDLVVTDVERSRRRFLQEVMAVGGHLQQQTREGLVVRIPSEHFAALSDKARHLGRLMDEQIQARDVTRDVFELGLRVDNAERARLRLIELLERGGELEHVLRLEKELRRVTEEIEMLKGKRRQLEGEAAFSTLRLRLRANAPAPTPISRRKVSPFPWVREIGPEHVAHMPLTEDDLPDLLPASVEVPKTFVTLEEGPFEIRALSAQGARLWLRTRFVESADLAFWKTALLEELKKVRGYDVLETAEHDGPGGIKILELLAETLVDGEPYRYQLFVSVRSAPVLGTWVATVEHTGAKEGFDEEAAAIRSSLLGTPSAPQENQVAATAGGA